MAAAVSGTSVVGLTREGLNPGHSLTQTQQNLLEPPPKLQLMSIRSGDSEPQPPHGGVGAGFVYSNGMSGGYGAGSGVEGGWHTDRCTMS